MSSRTPDAMLALIGGIDVVHNFAFQSHQRATADFAGQMHLTPPLTFCNDYVTVCTAALGCPIAPVLANKQQAWLLSPEGQLAGWMHVDSETARQRAALGYPTVASWTNPDGHGHIAMVVPPPSGDARLFVSAAGQENFVRAPIERSFGLGKTLLFFTHE